MVSKNYLQRNPMPRRPRSQKARHERTIRYLTEAELDQFLAAISAGAVEKELDPTWLIRPVRFSVASGVRPSELTNLRWADISGSI
jgi:integrase